MDTLNSAVETISGIAIQHTSGQPSIGDSNKPLTHKLVTITFSYLPFRHAYPFKVSKEDDPKPPFKISFSMSDHDQVRFIECLQRRTPVRIGYVLSIILTI
jgi:hypothetical protein